jgi:hypothetical protein
MSNATAPLLEDADAPFVLAGIKFAPLHARRMQGTNSITVRRTSIGISSQAVQELGLQGYVSARYTVSLDGNAIALKLLAEPRADAVTIQRGKGTTYISAVPLVREHPHLIGKRAILEATEVKGWFVARFGAEVA